MKIFNYRYFVSLLMLVSVFAYSASSTAEDAKKQKHIIGAAKLNVVDLVKTQAFYEKMLGMKEVRRYDYDLETFEETIMGFEDGGPTIALFAANPKAELPIIKSQFPVVLIYTNEWETITSRIEKAGYGIRRFIDTEKMKISIATDPSGNRVEIYGAPGKNRVGGSKLIVTDRHKAEAFYKKVFGAKSGQVYQAENVYDEVLMEFGEGPFLALFEPLAEPQLPKSRFAVTAIYTNDFANVIKQLDEENYGYRKVKTQTPGLNIVIARDPAGNAIEIIERNE
ncbi:hypothetical protein NBRC116493_07020 [Aurantivibrio infirmus]